MAITQQDIDRLNAAITNGEHSVTYGGRSVTFRSVADLIRARDDAQAQMALQSNTQRPRTFHFNFKTLRGD